MSDGIVFTQAKRENTAVILALCGGSGSGKTKSALELAVGLAGDGKILVIDSEGARAKHYADEYEFLHYDWQPPYSPASLGALLRAADQQKIAVVIVDSMSSEHEDEGGLCDMAEEEYQKQKPDSKNSAAAWARPKSQHKHHIVRWLRTARCHVIFCCRASEKVKFERVERNGRMTTIIVPIGWTPTAEKNLLYDVTTSLLFTADKPGVPQPIKLYEKHKQFFPPDRPITREAGRALAAWAAGASLPPAQKPAGDELMEKAWEAARRGTYALMAFWERLDAAQRRKLAAIKDKELKPTAEAADAERQAQAGGPPEAGGEGPNSAARVSPPPANTPSLSELRGVAPNATAGKSAEEYVREGREEWERDPPPAGGEAAEAADAAGDVLSGEHSGAGSISIGAPLKNSAMPLDTGDIVGELGRKLTEAAQQGQKAFDQAWLGLTELERDLARPMRPQYREIAAQAKL